MTCVCLDACVCTRVHARAAACRHACTRMWICACFVSCACVVCHAETSQGDTCVHTAAAFCIRVHPVAHTHDPSLSWVATSARGKVCGRGACWRGGKRTHCRCSSGERNHYRWSTANSCKGWSPTRRDRDTHLLAQRPLVASSIDSSLPDPPIRNRFGRGRLA